MAGCATAEPLNKPVILTQSQIECDPRPEVPADEYVERDENGHITLEGQKVLSIFMIRQDFVITDCKKQLKELGTVLKIQGATITDVPPEPAEEKEGFFKRLF